MFTVVSLLAVPIKIFHESVVTTIPPSGKIADTKVEATAQWLIHASVGKDRAVIPLRYLHYSRIGGLPPEQAGVLYLVQPGVFRKSNRKDLLTIDPRDIVKNANGKEIGYKRLMTKNRTF